MEKKCELLSKTLMDASKIMFVSMFANYLLNQTQLNWSTFMLQLASIFALGYMAWLIHPGENKGE